MQNELYHYGVKGMKWGVRRTPEQLGYKSNKDVRQLGDALAKTVDAAVKYRESQSFQRVRGANNPIMIHNPQLLAKRKELNKQMNDLCEQLDKKYDKVDIDIAYEVETGRNYVTAILQSKDKHNNVQTYFNELYVNDEFTPWGMGRAE